VEKEGKDRRKDFHPMEHFTRLDILSKLVAGEGIDRQVRNIRDFMCFMLARNLIRPCGRGRRHLDDLLEEKRLAADLFAGSTLAGYGGTLDVDLSLASDYEMYSKQGRKALRDIVMSRNKYFSPRNHVVGHLGDL
jgi:hypothetical protein